MSETTLIRAGLPWSSPLKIIIDSSEVINDMTINRGLLNLLNNDYYLDLKTEAISHYIESNIADHIADKSIHFTIDSILDLLGAGLFLQSDASYKIPVMYASDNIEQAYLPIETINSFIDKLPKHLNGHTMLLEFVYVKRKENDTSTNTVVSCYSAPICLNGFSNGTLLIHSTTDIDQAILNPDIEAVTNIAGLKDLTVNFSERLNTIVKEMTNNVSTNICLDAFEFRGTGVNQYYSVFSLNDNTADIYLYNCKITNTLSAFTTEAIEEAKKLNYTNELPALSTLNLTYLCNEDTATTDYFQAKAEYTLSSAYKNSKLAIQNNSYVNAVLGKDGYTRWQAINTNYPVLQTDQTDNINIPGYVTVEDESLYAYLENWIYGYDTLPYVEPSPATHNFSMCFWITPSTNFTPATDIEYPLFSFNIPQSGTVNQNLGIAVYINKLYNYLSGDLNISPYISNNRGVSLQDKTFFVTIDFVRKAITEDLNRSCYVSSWTNQYPVYKNPELVKSNSMMINVTLYNVDECNALEDLTKSYCENIFIPNKSTIATNVDSTSGNMYFRDIPSQDSLTFPHRDIRFFGNKINISNTETAYNWNYFSGLFRNIFMFNKILSNKEVYSLIKSGVKSGYGFAAASSSCDLVNSISTSSYIGALSVYNSTKVSLVKNIFSTKI